MRNGRVVKRRKGEPLCFAEECATRARTPALAPEVASVNDTMSPLKDTQPAADSTAVEARAVKAAPAAENGATADLENVPTAPCGAKSWTEIQKRAYHGSGIFDAAPAPAAAPRPGADAPTASQPPSVEAVAAEAAAPSPIADPSKMSLQDLRAACRARGLNPGGGKNQLCERLLEANLPAGDSKRLGATLRLEQPPDAGVPAAGVKRDADSESPSAPVAKAAKIDADAANVTFAARVRSADAFLADVMNSPKPSRLVTVSDAKLRDLGVGADVFFHSSENQMSDSDKLRKPFEAAYANDAAKAKAKEAAGAGDPFAAFETDANAKPSLSLSRPAGATDMHAPTHSVFATADADARADPHEATKKLVGGKHVSETLTRSLFEGSRLFDDDAERAAVAANETKARAKDDGESRVTASKHHEGHGIFSEAWVVPREVEEGEAIDGDVPIEPATAEEKKDAPLSDAEEDGFVEDGFKPIGACSPCVDLRWKTEEEEEAEEAVAILVYEAIRRVLDRASQEAFYAKEEGK